MKIVFIGAGNVATHLAKELYKKSFDIIQVYSRTLESASYLAKEVNAVAINDISAIIDDADLYIFSVKDSVLEDILSQLPTNKGIWVHTAGSLPLDIFAKYTSKYAVLYPFQTFSKHREIVWQNVPIFIEASGSQSLSVIKVVANQLSENVLELSSDKRRYVHLTGVFACNFTNHMYALSKLFLEKAGLPFETALPLIDETASKVHILLPKDAQTGPAVRFDENIINKHLEMIEDEKIKELYRLISEDIHRMS
ncbi:Rossmann-like and DUF2520 domain-containing protein [Prevotella sp. 10(H)]|uniref:Rossmann-like and DUF2520 domain-containing protein n=1 Tax=Prevotella sp. 10(H) TaxID=1158294 RepID=UPI0004A7325B|nr:Rossmann-like and DUF2520 domain-containing protein [Prevotella sp. 10(H)]